MRTRRRWWFWLLLPLLGLVVVASSAQTHVLDLANWFKHSGALGIATYFALYAVGALLVAPASALTLLAGFCYGAGLGFVVALPAASLAAWLNFLFARFVGHAWVERRLAHDSRWRLVRDAASRQGFLWVFLLRLSPFVPFAVLNYLMGVSQIRQRDFVLASTLGKAPSTLAYAYLGSALHVLAAPSEHQSPWNEALFWVGLVATLVVAWQLSRVVRRRTETLLAPAPSSERG